MRKRFTTQQFLLGFLMAGVTGGAWAGLVVPVGLPTLDEYALFGLAAAVGVAGAIAVFRRRK